MKDYYALLGVKPNASTAHVDAAYRRLMQKHHPNVRATTQALERMRELNEAWRVLSDPAQREAYDRARTMGMQYQPPTPVAQARVLPQSGVVEFGARPRGGGTCLVGFGILMVLVFAVGVLMWGLNEQVSFVGILERAQNELGALVPLAPTRIAAEDEITPTPDPRCRNGCETPPAGCVVKGDVEPGGARFFYLPNDEGYGDVVVDIAAGDRWFCALTDAQGAGWTRKAPTPTPSLPPPPEAFTTAMPRRNYLVCASEAVLREGPGDEFAPVQNVAQGARVAVTGVNGEWSVVSAGGNTVYVRTASLCAPPPAPTRAAAPAQNGGSTANAPTATAAITAAPVAQPASNFKYAAPQLVEPTDGAHYWCSRELVLGWAGPALGPDEYYLVESKAPERQQWTALADWTRETSVKLSPSRGGGACDAFWWANTGVYEWRVSVVRGERERPEYLSPFSPVGRINYGQ